MSHDMESRFYYFQGQNPQNTNISDRSHALHITGDSWGKITKHLDRKKLAKEAMDKEERHKAYLDKGSKSMIKNWANSLENIRKRKDEERAQAIENEKAERARKFHELRKEQEEIRKAFVDKANRNIFMNKGNAKQLTSAYIMGEVLYEREKQKEFKKFLLKHEAEEYAKEVEGIRKVAREAEEEGKGYKENERRKRLEVGELMRKEMAEKEMKAKEEAEKRKQIEEKEYNEALDELNCMKQKDMELKLKKKQELGSQVRKTLEDDRQRKILLQTEEKELDDVVNAYKEAKDKIDCMRKAREISLRQEVIEARHALAEKAKATSTDTIEEAKREKALLKAIREREEQEAERERKEKEIRDREKRDKLENHREFMEKEEERLKKEAELRKWEMLNRYKTIEAIDKFNKNGKTERRNKILQYRSDLLEQMGENEADRKKEEAFEKIVTETMSKTDDVKFFEYADEILAQERKTGRSTYPTEKAIVSYKKNFNISVPADVRCEHYKLPDHPNAMDIVKHIAQKEKDKCRCNCERDKIK